MKIHFITPNRISLINLTTIGDSEKRDDPTKIGQFSSGQAYSTALLLRDGVDMSISIFGGLESFNVAEDNYRVEEYNEYISYSTLNRICESTSKSKEVIVLNYEKQYHGRCNSSLDFSEPRESESGVIETAFALNFGYNWEIWMALRELWSNMLDEGGYVVEDDNDQEIGNGTVITLEFNEDNAFYEVWKNKHLYINEQKPLFVVSNSAEALYNEEGYLRIYKQNILVYENKERPSRFAWNIKFGQIDERRILSDVYSVEQSITSYILNSTNEAFLREIITPDFKVKENEFLGNNCNSWSGVSDLIHNITTEIYEEFGDVKSYNWLIDKVKKRKDCKIGGKKITTVQDSLWSYSKEVTIESSPQTFAEPSIVVEDVEYVSPFAAEIKKYYNFNLDVEVKKAKLLGSKVVADKYEKCLVIDEDFSIEEDFHNFIVEYLDLTQPGNVVENLSKYICTLLKK